MEALICGHATVVELLLAAKADKNLKGKVSPPPSPAQRERAKDPPTQRLHVHSHPQERATCALEAKGMTPRVSSAHWGEKLFILFTT